MSVYGLVTPDTVVQVPAPDGLDRRLKLVAALCVLSIAGAVQVTLRLLPVPCASDTAFGVFGKAVAVVSVLVADHALVPMALSSEVERRSRRPPPGRQGVRAGDACHDVQMAAPEGLDCRLKPAAALWLPSIAGLVQVTVRLLPTPLCQ